MIDVSNAEAMNVEEVNFIGKMILDEVMELLATVMRPEVAKDALKTYIEERYTRNVHLPS